MVIKKRATSKFFFVLSLPLLINPSLHCMNSTENMKIMGYASIALAAGLGASAILIFKALFGTQNKNKKQDLPSQDESILIKSENESLLTITKKLREQYELSQETGEEFDFYGIFKDANDEKLENFYNKVVKASPPYNFIVKALLDCKKQSLSESRNTLVLTSNVLSKEYTKFQKTREKLDFYGIFKDANDEKLENLYNQVVEGLLPKDYAIFLKKKCCLEYDSSYNFETSMPIYDNMKAMSLNGIVVLMSPPSDQKKRKILVVPYNSEDSVFSVFHIYDDEGKSCVVKIEPKRTQFLKGLLSHIILVANVSKDNLETGLKKSHSLSYWIKYSKTKQQKDSKCPDSNVIVHNSFEEVTNTYFRAQKAFQKDVISCLFPKNYGNRSFLNFFSIDDGDNYLEKANKAVLMISLQNTIPPYNSNSTIRQLKY